jgi:hypothetical protein
MLQDSRLLPPIRSVPGVCAGRDRGLLYRSANGSRLTRLETEPGGNRRKQSGIAAG